MPGIVDLQSLQGIGDILPGIGTLAKDIRQAITGEISAEKKAEIDLKLLELQHESLRAQIEVNKAEATNTSRFVSGWRPFIGWCCGIALGMYFVLIPTAKAVAAWFGQNPVWPDYDIETLIGLLVPMLGLGAYRTVEKIKGVQASH